MKYWFKYIKWTCVGCDKISIHKERVFDESKKGIQKIDYWCAVCENNLKPEKTINLKFINSAEL